MPPSGRHSNAQPSAALAATCYPAQPRNRNKTSSSASSRSNGSPPYGSGSSRASSVTSPPAATAGPGPSHSPFTPSTDSPERCICRMPGCGKSYNRVYDLVRHLTGTAHRGALADADDATLLASGIPAAQLVRVQQLLGRQNKCDVCGASYSRRDALRRHLVEAGHRLREDALAPSQPLQAPPPGFQWALVPTLPPTPAPMPMPQMGFVPPFDPFAVPPMGFEYTAPVPQSPPPSQQQPWFPQEQQALFDETMAMWFGGSTTNGSGGFGL